MVEGVEVPKAGGWWDIQGKVRETFANSINKVLTGYKLDELRSRVYEKGIPELGSSPAYERVAARIMLDNQRIRKELYYEVLSDFANRIERLYNEKKGDDKNIAVIIQDAQKALKELYENAPATIKESEWASEKIDEDYRDRVEFLKEYEANPGERYLITDAVISLTLGAAEYFLPNPDDQPLTEIERSIQEIIDGFKEYIKHLAIATNIQQEMRYLDLKAHVYGGEESFEDADEILLGDTFRVGFSARVSPFRVNQKWTIYYYALSYESNGIKLLAQTQVSSKSFNPDNKEGRWVVEAPAQETFVKMKEAELKEFFPQERWYFIRPVLAFGEWSADPVAMVGPNALKNPIDYPELFAEDRAAFVGERAEFGVVKAHLIIRAKQHINKGDNAKLFMAMRFPRYAAEELAAGVTIEAQSYKVDGTLPSITPAKHGSVVNDNYSPPKNFTESDISFSQGAKEGSYLISIKPKIRGFADEFQPETMSITVNFVDQEDPQKGDDEKSGNRDEDQGKDGDDSKEEENLAAALLSQIKGLQVQMNGLSGELSSSITGLEGKVKELEGAMYAFMEKCSEISKQLRDKIKVVKNPPGGSPEDILNRLKKDGEELGRLRSKIEGLTLQVCEAYEKIKKNPSVDQADQILSNAHSKTQQVDAVYRTASSVLNRMKNNKAAAEKMGLSSSTNNDIASLIGQAEKLIGEKAALDQLMKEAGHFQVIMNGVPARANSIVGQAESINSQAKGIKSKGYKAFVREIKKIYKSLVKDPGKNNFDFSPAIEMTLADPWCYCII